MSIGEWPAFHGGRGIQAEIRLNCPAEHESMTIVIPIGERRFYYNRKINCLPARRLAAVRRDAAKSCCPTPPRLAGLGARACGSTAASGTGPAPPASCWMGDASG